MPRRRIGDCEIHSSITDDLEQVAIQIEEVETVVIALIDRLCAFDAGAVKPMGRGEKVFAADAKRVVAAAERMRDDLRALGGSQLGPRDLEQRQVLPSTIHQNLIAEAGDDRKAEHLDIETLGAWKIANLDPKMVEPFKLHSSTIPAYAADT